MSAPTDLSALPDNADDLEDDLFGELIDIRTNLGQVAGTVYGGMHQHRHQTVIETKFLNDLVSRHQLTTAYVEHVARVFAPRSYRSGEVVLERAEAARLVTEKPWTVLLGARNSGLRTAAVALLHESSHAGRRFEEILIDEEGERPFTGGDLPAEKGVIYLLRLPDQPERVSPDLARHLHMHAAHLATIGAHLLVATTVEVWRAAGGGGAAPVIEVSAPAPTEVVRQECASLEVDATTVIGHPVVVRMLADAGPTDAVRLARIIVAAVRKDPSADLESLVREVQGAYGDWDDELARWFADEKKGLRVRLFLVAAAILEGERASAVLSTLNSLGRHLGDLPVARPDGLAEAGLRTLVDAIGAEIVDGRLRFRRANYASAVLTFIHSDRSASFRRRLWEWAVDLPLQRRGQKQNGVAERIISRLVAMVLRSRDTRPLVRLDRWTGRSDLQPYVVQALTSTAVSDEVGADVRALLYRWSRSGASEQSLCTIAEVCSGELAELYPRVSLTRLGHLAARESMPVRRAVVAAVVLLWSRPRQRRRIIEAIISWLTEGSGARAETAWESLTALGRTEMHPVVHATRDAATREALVHAAVRLLDRPDPGALVSPFGAGLLDAALGSGEQEELIVNFIRDVVRHGDGGSRRLVRITKAAFEWQPVIADEVAPARRDLRDRLGEILHRVDPLTTEG
jgi:hypothetical protein